MESGSRRFACQVSESSSDEEIGGSVALVARTPGASVSPTHPTKPSITISERETTSPLEGYTNDFVLVLDTKHQCQICMLALREPYQTQCGHRFCHGCILRWIRQRPTCPFDNDVLTENTIYPDNFAKREILLLKVRCKNVDRGCKVIMELKNYEDHLAVCPHTIVQCQLGCGLEIELKDVEKHEKYLCVLRRFRCSECGDQVTFAKVGEHQIACPKSQIPCKFCQVIMDRDKIDHHQRKECPEVLTKCTYSSYGCVFEKKRKFLAAHIESSTNKHLEYLSEFLMTHGLFGETQTPVPESRPSSSTEIYPTWPQHSLLADALPRRPMSLDLSPNRRADLLADSVVTRQGLDLYAGSDPGPMVSSCSDYGTCSYKDGYNSHGAQSDHYGSISYPPRGPDPSQTKIRSLQSKVAQQEQLICELQGKLLQHDNMKAQVEVMQSKLENVEERVCNGQYLWRIDQYSKLIEDATKGKMTVIHSKGFYTSVYGYKVCLRINLNNKGTYLSIFVHLMQGEYDDYLDWPFAGKITLRVLDQNSMPRDRKPVTETFIASPNLAAFQRPTSARNHKGFGYMEFIPLAVIRDGTYLRDDAIVIKAEIFESVKSAE